MAVTFCRFRAHCENCWNFHWQMLPKLNWNLHKICHSIFASNYYIELSVFALKKQFTVAHGQSLSSAKQSTANQSDNDDNLMHVATKMDLNWGILRRSWSLKIYVFDVLCVQFYCLHQHHKTNNKKMRFCAIPSRRTFLRPFGSQTQSLEPQFSYFSLIRNCFHDLP